MAFPAYTPHAAATPLERAADAIGWHPIMLRDLVALARWSPDRQATAFAAEGWLETLQADAISVQVAKLLKRLGPAGPRELASRELRAKVNAPTLLATLADYAAGPAMLLGASGCGKTLTALLMARKFTALRETERLRAVPVDRLHDECSTREQAQHVAWVSCSELPRLVANQPYGREPELVERAKRAPLVVLDDLSWGANDKALLEIIAHRYDHGLPSVSTGGDTVKKLVGRFGDAVVRRLLECRGAKGVVVEAF